MSDEYLEVIAFQEVKGKDKAQIRNCGFAKKNQKGVLKIYIQSLPVGSGWDGTLTVQEKRQKSPADDMPF